MRSFAVDFYEHSFSYIVDVCFHEIELDTAKVEEIDKIHLFVLISFFLKFGRLLNKEKQILERHDNFDISIMGVGLQLDLFAYLYASIVQEISKPRKRDFNIKNYHAYIETLLEILYIIREMRLCANQINRKNAKILQQNMFSREIVKVIRYGFLYYLPLSHDKRFTKTLIVITMIFFDLLEDFTKGKIFNIQTDKRIRRRVKKKKKKKKKLKQE